MKKMIRLTMVILCGLSMKYKRDGYKNPKRAEHR